MIELHPEYLSKNGERQFVVLSYEEYLAIEEFLVDVEDLIALRSARQEEGEAPTVSLEEVKRRLGLQ